MGAGIAELRRLRSCSALPLVLRVLWYGRIHLPDMDGAWGVYQEAQAGEVAGRAAVASGQRFGCLRCHHVAGRHNP